MGAAMGALGSLAMARSPIMSAANALAGGSMNPFAAAAGSMGLGGGGAAGAGAPIGAAGAMDMGAQPVPGYVDPMVNAVNAPKTPVNAPVIATAPSTPVTPPGQVIDLEDYTRQAAAKYGIDPEIAVKVGRSEGGFRDPVRQSNVKRGGLREPSYGPFQLLVGGPGTGFPRGLGNVFMEQTGLDPRKPENAGAAIDFAMKTASKSGWGQWYGAKAVGVGPWDGISGKGTGVDPTPKYVAGNATTPQTGQQQGATPTVGQPGYNPSTLERVFMAAGARPQGSAPDGQPSGPAALLEQIGKGAGGRAMQAAQAEPSSPAVDLGAQEVAQVAEGLRQQSAAPRMNAQERKRALMQRMRGSA